MIKDKRANRYSLVHTDIYGKQAIIQINYLGKSMKKLPLAIIDEMTTNYADEKEFMNALVGLNYDFGHLHIEYKDRGETKLIGVAYADQERIAKESRLRNSTILNGKDEPKKSENVCLLVSELENIPNIEKELWGYLKSKKIISRELAINIATYNHFVDFGANPNDILDYHYDITKEVGKYRIFRDIHMGIGEYTRMMNAKNTIFDNEPTIEQIEVPRETPKVLEKEKPYQPRLFNPDDYI